MNPTQENATWLDILDNNGTIGPTTKVASETEKKLSVSLAIFISLAVMGTIGNSISILALGTSKKLRNATTAFITSLCVADLSYCLLTILFFIKIEGNQTPVFCEWYTFARYFVAGESVYTLIAITVNRYVCIVHPKIYRRMYKPKLVILHIFITWAYAGMMASLPFFKVWGRYGYDPKNGFCTVLYYNGKSAKDFFFISAFAFPTVAFMICYPRILWVVHKSSKKVKQHNPIRAPAALNAVTFKSDDGKSGSTELTINSSSGRQDDRELKILKIMIVVVVSFIICYFPIAFIKLFEMEAKLPLFNVIGYLGVTLSNVINPIIYVAMSEEYRKAYSELFCFNRIRSYLTHSSQDTFV